MAGEIGTNCSQFWSFGRFSKIKNKGNTVKLSSTVFLLQNKRFHVETSQAK